MVRHFAIVAFLFSPFSLLAQGPWTLEKCVAHAFENNLSIKQAELGVQNAEIGKTEAWGSVLPNLNGSASHGYNWGQTIDPFTNTFATDRIRSNNFSLSTGMTLFSGFRNLNNIKQSETQLSQSETDLLAARNDIALTVASSYLTILLNQELLNIARANVISSNNQVERVRTLVEGGQVPEGNLAEIEAQLYLDQATEISAQNNLELAYLALAQLLQLSQTEADDFRIESPDLDALGDVEILPSAQAAVSYAVNNFPQIRSAETGVLSAEYAMNIAQSGRYPSLFANFAYGTGYSGANQRGLGESEQFSFPIGETASGETVLSLPTTTFTDFETTPFGEQLSDNINRSLFFSLQVPVFNGFAVNSGIQRAKVGMESAKLGLEQVRQALTQTVERSFADAMAAKKNLAASEKALEATEKAFGYAKVRFEEGVSNAVDFNDVRIRRDNAQADLLRNKYDYVFKAKVLDFYMGKPILLR